MAHIHAPSYNGSFKLIAKIINSKGKIFFDKNFPDGTYKKDLNSSKINSLGWRPKIKLYEGLREVIKKKFS